MPNLSISKNEFLHLLTESGLLPGSDLNAMREDIESSADDNESSLREITSKWIANGKLTKFQIESILSGGDQPLKLGNYVILEKLGAGGMGEVYKARHTKMNRIVAIKTLPNRQKSDAKQRFQREVEAVASLDHPNIVTAYDADEIENVVYFAMQYVPGDDLMKRVKSHGPFNWFHATDLIRQAAVGLDHAHRSGVIHRDIKPANLLLTADGTVKILDMGLANFIKSSRSDIPSEKDGLTETGLIMGTVDYMAPEQATNAKTADQRSDIYSLGCTFSFLINAKAVYEGDSLTEKLIVHQSAPIPAISSSSDEIPDELNTIFQRMIAKNPDDRFSTMAEVITRLEKILQTFESDFNNVTEDFYRPNDEHIAPDTKSLCDTSSQSFDSDTETVARAGASSAPNSLIETPKSVRKKRSTIAAAIVGAFVLAVVVFGIVILLKTPDGNILITIGDADQLVNVNINKNNSISIVDPNDGKTIRVSIDRKKKLLRFEKDGFEAVLSSFSLSTKKGRSITVEFQPIPEQPSTKPVQDNSTSRVVQKSNDGQKSIDVKKSDVSSQEDSNAQRDIKRAGDANPLIRSLTDRIEKNIDDAEAYSLRSLQLGFAGFKDLALLDIRKAISLRPTEALYQSNLGNILKDFGNVPDSIPAFSEAIRLDSSDATYLLNRAMAYAELGKWDQAIADASSAVPMSTDKSFVYHMRGNFYAKKGDNNHAFEDYENAIKLNDKNSSLYSDRGNLLMKENKLQEAIADYSQAIKIEPKSVVWLTNRGMAYLEAENLQKAMDDFRKAIELDENAPVPDEIRNQLK